MDREQGEPLEEVRFLRPEGWVDITLAGNVFAGQEKRWEEERRKHVRERPQVGKDMTVEERKPEREREGPSSPGSRARFYAKEATGTALIF